MKTRVFLFLAVMMASVSIAGAQNHDKRMAQIRQAYADRLEIMNNNPYESQMFNQVNVDLAQNMPGSGLREVHDRYYFTQEQYSTDGSMDSQVYFVTSTITYAMGAHKWYWEFLWDSMEGDPMFAYLVRQEGDARQEYRFYFEKNKLIKVVPDLKQWPKDDGGMNLHPQVISKPADVLKLMKEKQAEFMHLIKE